MAMAAEIENSPSNSQSSSTHPPPPSSPKKERGEEDFTAMDTDASALPDNKPLMSHSLQCFTPEEITKYDKYEADYASYLRAKYFSEKDVYGGDIFDLTVTVGNETVKASRRSPTQSFANPAQSFVDYGSALGSREETPSASGAETASNIANGNVTPIKKTS
ncbi:hypothetical protein SOVF_049210 [Spinacia oleracea]|uniref:OCRE domain-containing protein n=1 Tax=Spinacia oleracea TaxID=3562 RepID=A0A9R0IUA7_SPIOL|nr:uncharacterized protein LOC110794626 [Spinacia oleracea]KNA20778.1 hypothetical protein SOVF_049210 [Spinacia oleracea]